MTKKKLRIKKKYINIFFGFLFITFLSTFCISLYNIIKWKLDSNKTNNTIIQIQKDVKIDEVDETDNIEIIEPVIEDEINLYWDYIKMNLIDVDFDELKSTNKQTKGWIQVNGTNINYPIVQASNNKYYLTHSFDKSYNRAGWVFLDYRNKLRDNDKNTIIYAHSRLDKTMFGSLKNILSNGWLNNPNNYIVKLSTEYENTLWQVFSVYQIPTTSDYLQIIFNSDTQFKEFADMLVDRSSYNFNTAVSETDRMLTLSTCYNDNDKLVLHAKLIKREVK